MPRDRTPVRLPALWVEQSPESARIELEGPGASSVVFTLDSGRVRVGLVLPGRGRPVDVTIQPGVGEVAVRDALSESGVNPEPALRALQSELTAWASRAGCRVPPQLSARPDLGSTIAVLAFPLLGLAADSGAAPPREIPRWSAGLLAHRDPRSAAAELVRERPSRRLVRAFARSLVPDDPPDGAHVALGPLALAAIASGLLDQDRVSNVLEASGPWQPSDTWPDVEQMDRARRCLGRMAPDRAYRLVLDARRSVDGISQLLHALRLFGEAHRLLVRNVPSRIDALRTAALEVLPVLPPAPVVDVGHRPAIGPGEIEGRVRAVFGEEVTRHQQPTPDAGTRQRRRPSPEDRGRSRAAGVRRHRALRAPLVSGASPAPSTPILYGRGERTLDGLDLGIARLTLPRTVADLDRWGQLLHNCLGDFGSAAVNGLSVLIGVTVDDRLTYCLELTREGSIRQFHGPRNTAVPGNVYRAVTRAVRAHGLLRAPTGG